MNSITKEFEHFSRKVIEHARGTNGGFETGMQAWWCPGQNFVPFAPQTTAHLLLRRFAFFLESPFCPWMPRDASCYGPTSRPDAAAVLTQPKICSLFNMLSPPQSYVLSLPFAQPWIAQQEFLWTRRAVHRFNDSHRDCCCGQSTRLAKISLLEK